jgi:hypothetical protein
MDRTSDGLAEIVEEIMNNLRPWTCCESEGQAGIHKAIEFLRVVIPFINRAVDNRSAIKKSAQEFGAAIAEVEKSLHDTRDQVIWRLFGELPKLHFDGVEGTYDADFPAFDEIKQVYVDRVAHFQEELRRLRVECEKLVRNPGGPHPNTDIAKKFCARGALDLMHKLSENPPTGTAEGRFRIRRRQGSRLI